MLINNIELQASADSVGTAYVDLFNSNVRIVIENGSSTDYAETCISHLNNMSDTMLKTLLEKIVKYCGVIIDDCGLEIDDYQDVFGLTCNSPFVSLNPSAILKHISPNSINVVTPQLPIPAYSIYCDCD